MAYTTINKPTDHFNTKLYTGNGGTNAITGVGFQPDWVWLKGRSYVDGHVIYDALRGTNYIQPNTTGTQSSIGTGLSSLDSDGFTLGSWSNINRNSENHVSWNWKANGIGSSNTDGTINSTYTSANTTSGFSIVQYTGTGSAGATVGHGLGVAPKMIIVKGLSYADVWIVGGDNLGGWNKELYLNNNNAVSTNTNAFYGVTPTSSVFTLGSGNATNKSGETYVAYVFAEKRGYSKFGSYIGNADADGTFVYTGFKPAFIIVKNISSSNHWILLDNKREGYNPQKYALFSNQTNAETGDYLVDFTANGFKVRTATGALNEDGETLMYMAFAQALLGGTNDTPAVAL